MSTPISLIGTGVTLGVVHVLSGPDHLSALAALSANVSCMAAFYLGIRWGIGHSLGILLVATILIALTLQTAEGKLGLPPNVTTFFQALVGVIMILLGLYAMWRAFDHRRRGRPTTEETAAAVESALGYEEKSRWQSEEDSKDFVDPRSDPNFENTQSAGVGTDESPGQGADVEDQKGTDSLQQNAMSTAEEGDGLMKVDKTRRSLQSVEAVSAAQRGFWGRCCSRISTGSMAIVTGIVHGVAGPGGVLGVIPAVQLRDWRLAFLYLGCFCISSTLTMAIFATLYGSLTSWMSRGNSVQRQFWIELVSASLSIIVGVVWLILMAVGKLNVLFDHSSHDMSSMSSHADMQH